MLTHIKYIALIMKNKLLIYKMVKINIQTYGSISTFTKRKNMTKNLIKTK